MRAFLVIWSGQLFSTIGSYMTVFAVISWVWEQTESASALTTIQFFSILPRIPLLLIAGGIVDRLNRKRLMILGDTITALCTLSIGLLHSVSTLQIWHLCCAVAVHACFGQLQQLAYLSAIPQLLPKQHYTRASSMNTAIQFSGAIAAPGLAGLLYSQIGLGGIIGIDLLTFGVALGTLLMTAIPSLVADPKKTPQQQSWQGIGFGIRYIRETPGLLAMVVLFTLFAIPNDLGHALYNALILARSSGDEQLLGMITVTGGVGGLLGAITLSVWGGFQPRIHGVLLGFIGAGISRFVFSLGQSAVVWMPAQFCAAFLTPFFVSSTIAIWYAKVPQAIQGRVLAVDQLVGLIVGAIATLTAGPLAEGIFEPAIQPGGTLAPFRRLFGSGDGGGIALLFAVTALWMIAVGVGGYTSLTLRTIDRSEN